MTTSCTDFDHPYYSALNGKNQTERVNFFTEGDFKKMKFVSLGEVLDFVSAGGMNFVHYHFSDKKMIQFIQSWMEVQIPRIEYERKKSKY
ncbi:hypothetical protein HN832_04475 [archaeon]|jgi:hypothetical protein|nr:hypothetical protein [archaeon]MBT4373351.1 hypothetical protein [archaeon]MBT4531799.1 hypothetical protein [archaeon]MBT7001466.1 hypothetical protein [archaeon]MBT7282642.1 hypothetical protein [archaeon]